MIELEKHPVETEAGDQFRECIIMTALKNSRLKMRELLEMSREIGFLIDEPQHEDYFDPFAIMLAELFTEYQEYGRFPNWTYNMDDVKEFVIDKEAKDFLLQTLDDIYNESKIEGREREICIQWQKTEMTEIWKRHLESLISSLRKSIPYKETEEEIIERKKKEEKENILKTRKLNKIQIIRISIIYSPFSNLCIVFKASCQVGTEKPIASVFFILNVEL